VYRAKTSIGGFDSHALPPTTNTEKGRHLTVFFVYSFPRFTHAAGQLS